MTKGTRTVLPTADIDAIEAALDPLPAVSERTKRNYRKELRAWWRWCAREGRQPWPARPVDVATYATELIADGTNLANVRLRITTVLGRTHTYAGLANPAATEGVRAALGLEGVVKGRARLRGSTQLSTGQKEAIDAVLAAFGNVPPSTIASYRAHLRNWWRWCARESRQAWPARPEDVVAYAMAPPDSERNASVTAATRRQFLAALGRAHRLVGLPSPCADALAHLDGGQSAPRELPSSDEQAIAVALGGFSDVSESGYMNYRSRLRMWWRWCAREGRQAWPALPEDVAAYVVELIEGGTGLDNVRHRISTVLGRAHSRAGLDDPCDAKVVRDLLWPGGLIPGHTNPGELTGRIGKLPQRDEAAIDAILVMFGDVLHATLASYRSNLRMWWRWCTHEGKQPWPASAEDVAAYASALTGAEGDVQPGSSDAARIAVIGRAHRLAGSPDPTASSAVRARFLGAHPPDRRTGRLPERDEGAINAVLSAFEGVSASTHETYRVLLRAWWRWCAREDRQPWPARPEDVAAYAAEVMADERHTGPTRVRRRPIAAIGRAHRLAGLPDPTTTEEVRRLLGVTHYAIEYAAGLPDEDEHAIDAVVSTIKGIGPVVRANYRSSLRAWWRWCAREGRQPWPAHAADMATYAAELLDGERNTTKRTVRRYFIAPLGRAHRSAGLPDPTEAAAIRAMIGSHGPRNARTVVTREPTGRIGTLPERDERAIDAVLAAFGKLPPLAHSRHRGSLRIWWRWCVREGRRPWPAELEDVMAFTVEMLGAGIERHTLRAHTSSTLGRAHRVAGLPDPCASPEFRRVLHVPPRGGGDINASAILQNGITPSGLEAVESALKLFPSATTSPASRAETREGLLAWWRWCAREDKQPWPARTEDVAGYAAELVDVGAKPDKVYARLRRVLGHVHRLAGLPDPSPPAGQIDQQPRYSIQHLPNEKGSAGGQQRLSQEVPDDEVADRR